MAREHAPNLVDEPAALTFDLDEDHLGRDVKVESCREADAVAWHRTGRFGRYVELRRETVITSERSTAQCQARSVRHGGFYPDVEFRLSGRDLQTSTRI